MDESVGTKASPCFRNRCWNGPRRHPRNPLPAEKLQALGQRSLAIHWTPKPGHGKTLILSKRDGAKGWECNRRCPKGKSRSARLAPTRHKQLLFFGDSGRTLVFNQARSGNQQCERLQISISITRPLTLGIYRMHDSGIRSCADV